MFYIYILHSEYLDKYYVGYSENPWTRVNQHNENSLEKYTGKAKDWKMKAVFQVSDGRSLAMKLEKRIKKQKSRSFLEKLIDPDFKLFGEFSQLVRVPHLRD